MSDSNGARVTLISSPSEFMALQTQWNALASHTRRTSVFYRHEWFDAAWQWRQQTARLHLICYFVGERLAAVLPLVVQRIAVRGFTVRELRFLTVPDTQACDMIVAEQERASASNAFAFELVQRCRDWDVLRLNFLAPESVATSTLRDALERKGFTTRVVSAPGNPFIALDSTWGAYYATRSRRLKKGNNLAANRLRKAGEVGIDWLAPGTEDSVRLASFLERSIRISAISWKSRTGNSLDMPGPQAFIRRLSALASQRGWLSIWTLSLNQLPVAMEYQLVADENVYALRSDFDAKFDEISPGTHLNRCLVEQFFGRGLRRYYMGPGDNAYKYRWTEEIEPLQELTVYGRTLAGRGLALWETALKPMAIKFRDRLGRLVRDDLERGRD
jgi:CelD/BcsL family acetyltransferase involved in cellulose biosynthesis